MISRNTILLFTFVALVSEYRVKLTLKSLTPDAKEPRLMPAREHSLRRRTQGSTVVSTFDPDGFDPNMTLADYSSLPPSWPTDNWLESCAASLQNDTNLVVPFPTSEEWDKYALGDCIKLCNKCKTGVPVEEWGDWETGRNQDLSNLTKMAHMYYRMSCPHDQGNLDTMEKVFQLVENREGFVKPDEDAVVLHLRLGDVVEFQAEGPAVLLTNGGIGSHSKTWTTKSIRSVYDYLDILKNLSDHTNKVVIVGGSHKHQLYKKSRVYAHCLQRGLAKAGKKVEMYLDSGNADKDFYFMSHAKYYIASTGGYSRYMGCLVERGGGKSWFADDTDHNCHWQGTPTPAEETANATEYSTETQKDTSNNGGNKTTTQEPTQLQMDILVPAYERDSRLRAFAGNLSQAILEYYYRHSRPKISKFRFLVTRYGATEVALSDIFQQELSKIAHLPLENIVMVKAPETTKFSRSRAINLLHDAACHLDTCLVAKLDVDMQVRQEFFQHSVQTVAQQQLPPDDELNQKWQTSSLPNKTSVVYFPIFWSTYSPEGIAIMEERYTQQLMNRWNNKTDVARRLKKKMPFFSDHRGHWRHSSYGMYVMKGTDAQRLLFDTNFEGWGGEDVDFYERASKLPRRILRRIEPGLIHQWHPKVCDGSTPKQKKNCWNVRRREEGSELARRLLDDKRNAATKKRNVKLVTKKEKLSMQQFQF